MDILEILNDKVRFFKENLTYEQYKHHIFSGTLLFLFYKIGNFTKYKAYNQIRYYFLLKKHCKKEYDFELNYFSLTKSVRKRLGYKNIFFGYKYNNFLLKNLLNKVL